MYRNSIYNKLCSAHLRSKRNSDIRLHFSLSQGCRAWHKLLNGWPGLRPWSLQGSPATSLDGETALTRKPGVCWDTGLLQIFPVLNLLLIKKVNGVQYLRRKLSHGEERGSECWGQVARVRGVMESAISKRTIGSNSRSPPRLSCWRAKSFLSTQMTIKRSLHAPYTLRLDLTDFGNQEEDWLNYGRCGATGALWVWEVVMRPRFGWRPKVSGDWRMQVEAGQGGLFAREGTFNAELKFNFFCGGWHLRTIRGVFFLKTRRRLATVGKKRVDYHFWGEHSMWSLNNVWWIDSCR